MKTEVKKIKTQILTHGYINITAWMLKNRVTKSDCDIIVNKLIKDGYKKMPTKDSIFIEKDTALLMEKKKTKREIAVLIISIISLIVAILKS